jgi:uncharacterized protein YjlB
MVRPKEVGMALLESAKKFIERLTGLGRPSRDKLADAIRARKPQRLAFRPDGFVPNNRWPLVRYRGAVRLSDGVDPAALFEDLFAHNGWSDSWRNGVYDYLHYHSAVHEVMGVARGSATVQFGGAHGRKLRVRAGDVVVLPAGTGHQCFGASDDFLVVSAYPATGKYDLCEPSPPAYERARKTAPKIPPPRKDPVYGKDGALLRLWKRAQPTRQRASR